MQAHPISRRLPTPIRSCHVLKRLCLRPLRRSTSSRTSAGSSATTSATSSSAQAQSSARQDGSTAYTQDGYRTFRARPGKRSLPLPPIMDPIALSARERWTEPKRPAPARQDLTPFQQKLYQNPYAHALATPVRLCRTTTAHLPTFFHLALHPKPHPTTGDPWLLPALLHKSASAKPSSSAQDNGDDDGGPAGASAGPTVWVASRRALVKHLLGKKRWRDAVNLRALDKLGARLARGLVWREDTDALALALYRDRVARLLRYGFLRPRGAGMLARLPPPPSPPPSSSAANTVADDPARIMEQRVAEAGDDDDDAGALLFLTPRSAVSDAARQSVRALLERCDALAREPGKIGDAARRSLKELPSGEVLLLKRVVPRLQPHILYPPLEYDSVGCGTVGRLTPEGRLGAEERAEEGGGHGQTGPRKRVPVYGLVELLGEEKVRELVEGTAWEGESAVVLREKHTTLAAHMALMQLQDYVIETL